MFSHPSLDCYRVVEIFVAILVGYCVRPNYYSRTICTPSIMNNFILLPIIDDAFDQFEKKCA